MKETELYSTTPEASGGRSEEETGVKRVARVVASLTSASPQPAVSDVVVVWASGRAIGPIGAVGRHRAELSKPHVAGLGGVTERIGVARSSHLLVVAIVQGLACPPPGHVIVVIVVIGFVRSGQGRTGSLVLGRAVQVRRPTVETELLFLVVATGPVAVRLGSHPRVPGFVRVQRTKSSMGSSSADTT